MLNFIRISELKEQISLSSFLAKLGHYPALGKTGREKKYLSMLRDSDTDPSFTVDDEKGLWFDHGLRQGGDLIDLAVLYWPTLEFRAVLEKIMEVSEQPIASVASVSASHKPAKKKLAHLPYDIIDIKPLGGNQVITDYLRMRGVWGIANDKMREVYYYVLDEKKHRKDYFAVGWQNQKGKWEIRNKYFKGSLGKKAITLIPGDSKSLVIFEGFMNYLTWLRYYLGSTQTVIVLNSLVNLPDAMKLARSFDQIALYFDHDATGRAATQEFILALPNASDQSEAYKNYNDYNEKLMQELKGFGILPAP